MRKLGVSALVALGLVALGPLARAQETGDDEETALQGEPNGLTADAVAKRAAQTSYQAQASAEALRGAAARVDAAWAAFLPRLLTVASYTRLSELTPPSLGTIVSTTQACSNPQGCPVDPSTLVGRPLSFPVILDK